MSGEGVTAVLDVRGLVAGYEPGAPIVRGASLAVRAGEIVALLGPNGAGKSTLVKAVAGLVPIESGQVTLAGRDITGLPAHHMVRVGLAFVPQLDSVFTRMTVQENLQLAGAVLPAGERRRETAAVVELFPDLAAQWRLPAGRLSGGQRQMLALARALIVRPRALMLDEPSAGLSPRLVGLVLAKLAEVRARGVGVLVVEQNLRAAAAVADHAYVLVEGLERIEAPAATLLDNPEVARLYLSSKGGSAPLPSLPPGVADATPPLGVDMGEAQPDGPNTSGARDSPGLVGGSGGGATGGARRRGPGRRRD